MDPNTPQPLTLVDYYALAIAPTIYANYLDRSHGKPIEESIRILDMARASVFQEAAHLATMSISMRTPPREGRSDEGTGDRVA
jgi:hypothetical protein